MHIRGVLFVVACLAAQGCSKDKAADPAAKPDPKGSGSAKPEPGLQLTRAPEAVGQPVTARTAVLIAKDGSLTVARLEPAGLGTLTVASVKGEPVAQVADLQAKIIAMTPAEDTGGEGTAMVLDEGKMGKKDSDDPPPEEPEEEEETDDSGGTGTAMALDEGKMGKKDSDRAEGQYKMKNNNADPELARQQALEEAKNAGILGTVAANPCGGAFASLTGTGDFSSGFDDADIYGGLLGNEPGEMSGGWGYGVGTGHSGPGEGFGGGYVIPAGLRATSVMDSPVCGRDIPLVLADASAPAARVVEVLSAFPYSQLAISADGGAHALTLAATFSFRAGSRPAATETPEVGFTLGADGARGSAYRGAREDATVWTWDGKSGGIADAFHAASEVTELRDTEVRIRVDGDVKAGALIEGIAALLVGEARKLAFGDPVELEHQPTTNRPRRGGPVPSVKIGQATATGDLDKAIIRRYIKRNLPKIQYCYEKVLLSKPGIEGTVNTQFEIGAKGQVTKSEATGVDPDVSSCVAAVIKAIEFPKPKGGKVVNVTSYPFAFRPSGG